MKVYKNVRECLRDKGMSPCIYLISELEYVDNKYRVVVNAIDPFSCKVKRIECYVREP